jgi:hypothetical protein
MTYTVKHFWTNPRNNSSTDFADDELDLAKEEMKKMESDESGPCSQLYKDGKCIAFRDWTKKRISWM